METSKEFTQYLFQQHQSKSTIKQKLKLLNPFLNFLNNDKIAVEACTYNDIIAYVKHLQSKQVKASYIQSVINALYWYFKYLISIKSVLINPVKDLKIKGMPRNTVIHVMKEDELEELYLQQQQLNYASYEVKQRDMVLFGLIVFQALQLFELKRLQCTDVYLQQGYIYIPETNRSKERKLVLHAKQIIPLMHYLAFRDNEKLFETNIENSIYLLFKKFKTVKQTANYQTIRASRIIIWLNQYHIRMVQYYTGMKYISSLKKYQEQQTDGLRDKINQYHPL